MAVRIVKRAVAAVFLTLAVWGLFGGHRLPHLALELQAVPAMLKHPLVAVPLFFGLTALIGRFFCETMCPLGILQSLVNRLTHPKTGVRRICTRLPETKAQRIVRWSVVAVVAFLLAAGYGALAYAVEPYSLLSRALAPYLVFSVLLGAILLVAAIGDGRLWCNWVCPLGTLFHLASRKAPFGNRVCKGCANCRKCFPKPSAEPAKAAEEKPAEGDGVTRREAMQGLVCLAAVEKTTDGGLAELVLPGVATSRGASVLPPGALSRARFQRLCVGCGLCVKSCTTGVLKPSTKLATFGQPELDLSAAVCDPDCDRPCARACPAGAILPLADVPRRDIHVGRAVWHAQKCIRTTDGVTCTLCSRKCPYGAIHLDGGAVVVDDRLCIGCGICENACAARPEPAIVVDGLDIQTVVRPIGEADLIAEMKTLLKDGDAVVVARDGVIRNRERGRGIGPLLKLHDDEALGDALVVDRVIGRATAAICVLGGVRRVHAPLMSKGAEAFLKEHGVVCSCDESTDQILNRDKSDICPMEKTVADLTSPAEMVTALRAKLRELREANAGK